MKLTDFKPHQICQFIWEMIDRKRLAEDRWPFGKSFKTEINLSIDEARMIFAARMWLQRYGAWAKESKGKIGEWPADFGISVCVESLERLAASINKDNPVIMLTKRDFRLMESAAQHLDHYGLMLDAEDGKKTGKKWHGKKS